MEVHRAKRPLLLLVLFVVVVELSSRVVEGQVTPFAAFDLRVEYMPSPVFGVDKLQPRFSWKLNHPERAQYQTAYQIQVSLSPDVSSGDVWDSSKVSSNDTTFIQFGGSSALQSDTSYYWKVIWWDVNGVEAPASEIAQFDTGLYSTSDWQGIWIGGFNQLRKEFTITSDSNFTRARIFISGLGYYELYLNGEKVGNNVLDPGWTHYSLRSLYVTYDVTELLAPSTTNVIGVMLGNGWYGQGWSGPKSLLFQLNLRDDNNSLVQSVVSDTTWTGSQSPITMDSIYNGETYDARLEQEGWSTPDFSNTSSWEAASAIDGPGGILSSQLFPPVQVVATLKPLTITEPEEGVYVYDFGQNFSGWCRVNVTGPAGTTVVLKHAEILYSNGSLNTANLRSALATDTYTLKGDPNGESYAPRFTYHGFRFVSLTGYPGVPTLETLEAYHVSSAVETTGSIEFSHELLNSIQHNILWGQTSNLVSVPTDCDQRDERLGWMADAQLAAEEAIHNFGMGSFYTNWVTLIADDEINGTDTDVVPFVRYGNRPADPAWGAAYPLVVYWMWQYYGDLQIIQNNYEGLKAYIDFLTSQVGQTGIGSMFGYYGDWVPPPPASKASVSFTSAYYYLLNTRQLAAMAEAIGNNEDATYYQDLYAKFSEAFNTAFLNGDNYDIGVQTDMILPMTLHLVPPSILPNLTNTFLNDIVSVNNWHLTTGILGTKYLMELLSALGRTDIALALATQATYPSWGYMIKQTMEASATTLWELWDAPNEGPGMNSRNHIMFGSVGSWFYRSLAGIKNAGLSVVGFAEVQIIPPPSNVLLYSALSSVSASYNSVRGPVVSSWVREGGMQCAEAWEHDNANIDCGYDGFIASVDFASFGTPTGQCGAYSTSSCDASSTLAIVESLCLGKSSCTVFSNDSIFQDPCFGTLKKLAIQVTCSNPSTFTLNVSIPVNTIGYVGIPLLDINTPTIFEGTTNNNTKMIWSGGYFFEETGITAAQVQQNTVLFTVGSGNYSFLVTGAPGDIICASGLEHEMIQLTCPESNQAISVLSFASFGTPSFSAASCGDFQYGTCHAGSSWQVIENACLGQNSCELVANDDNFGDPCYDVHKSFAVSAVCTMNYA